MRALLRGSFGTGKACVPLLWGVPPPKFLSKEEASPGEGAEMSAGSCVALGPEDALSQRGRGLLPGIKDPAVNTM